MTEANSPVSILVVDDEPNVLSTIQAILQHEGYVVDACGDGAAALRAIRERHYDLVLTDLKMPGVLPVANEEALRLTALKFSIG